MAFGPATANIQQAVLALLQGRDASPVAPVPLAPTGGIGPLDFDTSAALAALQPEPVPPALPGPVDADAIRSRIMALAGPEPVAPQPEPTSLIVRVARALQGFGAGTQGQGPQFLANLQEQREAPQREFRARKERFETRRQELGLLGEQAVLSAEERRAARTQELLDKQFEREFNQGVRRLNLRDQKEQELFRDALLAKRQREDDERQAEENRRKEAQATKIELAKLASKYRAVGAKGEIATELAQKDLDPTFKLSRAAEKWFSSRVALEEARARRPAGGSAGAGSPMVEVVDPQGNVVLGPLPYNKLKFDNGLVSGFPGASIRRAQGQGQPFPLQPGGSPEFSGLPPGVGAYTPQAAPKLNNQQRARFDDIKRSRPDLTDEQVQTYMRAKGWLK